LGALLVAVAAKVAELDEAGRPIVANLHVETGVLDRADVYGHDIALVDARTAARCSTGTWASTGALAGAAAFELLHAKRNPLLLDIDVEHLRLDQLTLAVELKGFLARDAPGDVRHVDHSVDIALEADEQPELGRVLDLALDGRADRMRRCKRRPRIFLRLLEAERNPALLLVHLEHLDVDFLRSADDLARMDVFLGPAHLGDVDQPLDARLELDEGAIFGDVGHPPPEGSADRVFGRRAVPRIALELLHAEADALSVLVDADDLYLHRIAD